MRDDCAFCNIVQGKAEAKIVYEDNDTIAFLDRYPQTRGHLQFIPKKHYRWIYDIAEIGLFFGTAQTIIRGIIPVLKANHVTIATHGHELEHAHLWIVPQYESHVSVLEGARGIRLEEDLEQVANLLRGALKTKK